MRQPSSFQRIRPTCTVLFHPAKSDSSGQRPRTEEGRPGTRRRPQPTTPGTNWLLHHFRFRSCPISGQRQGLPRRRDCRRTRERRRNRRRQPSGRRRGHRTTNQTKNHHHWFKGKLTPNFNILPGAHDLQLWKCRKRQSNTLCYFNSPIL